MSGEGKTTLAARLLGRMYASAPMRLRGPMRRLIGRLEGGEMVSLTLRAIMARHHGIEAGLHSYGCFDPARFNEIRVGRYVSTGPGVRVFRRNHPTDRISLHPYFYNTRLGLSESETLPPRPLVIGDDAWIGANAIVLPGCGRIGRGAVVGAGSVVTRDVPDFAVVAGNPARLIRERFPAKLRRSIERTAWWEKSREDLSSSLHLLQQPATPELSGMFQERIGQVEVVN